MALSIPKAFILGAGLGTRLRPLTHHLPKPLLPLWNAPLITFAFDHLMAELKIQQFMVNTHHAATKYQELFPDPTYRGARIEFRHETQLLDTAGGIDHIRDWLPSSEPFLVYNGDILTDLPLGSALEEHCRRDHWATLILRSQGANPNVAFDSATGLVTDLRNARGTDASVLYQFTGIYLVSPPFLECIEPGKIESVVFPFLRAIEKNQKIGGIVIDEGHWSDLGDLDSYLEALPLLAGGCFPRYGLHPSKCRIHSSARIDPSASIDAISAISQEAEIGANAVIGESIVWPGARVASGKHLYRTVHSGLPEK